ncbi:MAG: ester cyclase [Anaerolineales bacterium]|nr:ester cyclase [Anaerolineales bacterium]
MSPEETKARTKQMLEALNSADWDNQLRAFSPSPEAHDESTSEMRPFREAFPDYHFAVNDEDMVAESDRVVFWGTVTGTHTKEFPVGELAGVEAAGKKLAWYEVHFVKYEDGKMVEHLLMVDGVSRLQQLGVLPMPE